jgi:hypothetical protein
MQLLGEPVKRLTSATFEHHAVGSKAAEKNAAVRSVKRKEIRPPQQIRRLAVF